MSTIREPASATWWASDRWAEEGRLTLIANREDRNLILSRRYPLVPDRKPLVESVELSVDQLPEVAEALLNAHAWLERATAQDEAV